MKSKVIIENGQAKIVLNPENDFEIGMLENADNNNYDLRIHILSDSGMVRDTNPRIEILITEKTRT